MNGRRPAYCNSGSNALLKITMLLHTKCRGSSLKQTMSYLNPYRFATQNQVSISITTYKASQSMNHYLTITEDPLWRYVPVFQLIAFRVISRPEYPTHSLCNQHFLYAFFMHRLYLRLYFVLLLWKEHVMKYLVLQFSPASSYFSPSGPKSVLKHIDCSFRKARHWFSRSMKQHANLFPNKPT